MRFDVIAPGIFMRVAGLVAGGILAASAGAESLTYTNPVLPGRHPDPSVIRVGTNYWATSTAGDDVPVFPLLHSTDLVTWKRTGWVFERRPAWSIGNLWAPEISTFRGRYFIYYSARERNGRLAVAVATADQPGGPYTDHGPIIAQPDGSIDPAPFIDEKGNRYLIWKEDGNSERLPCILWAQDFDRTGTNLVGKPWELIRNDAPWEGRIIEGPYMLRHDGWYYLFYSGGDCCGANCNYALGVARSRSLRGPWVKDPANPILAGNARWRCPGHGSIVTDEHGRYWLLYHAYEVGHYRRDRQGMLDRVTFGADGWPTINDGQGPSVTAVSPFGLDSGLSGDTFQNPQMFTRNAQGTPNFDASLPLTAALAAPSEVHGEPPRSRNHASTP